MTKTHEIKLDGYGAHTTLAEDRPIMLLGTAESYGIEMLHIVPGKDWAELTITATFNASDGSSTDILMDTDGNVVVPSEATAKSGSGRIVFTGVSNGIQRISCDLEYFVVAHSAINGVQSGVTAPSWFEQAVTRFMPAGGTAGQVLTKVTDADFNAEWQDSQGGAGLAPLVGTTKTIMPSQVLAAIKAGRDIALQYTDSYYGTFVFSAFNANEKLGIVVSNSIIPQWDGLTGTLLGGVEGETWFFRATNTATKDDVGTAVNEALTAAKASGEFDGADGITPTIGDNGNWYLGDTDTNKPSRGEKGETGASGPQGPKGDTGATGADGKSAYSYAVDGGYTGTEAEFAAKLAAESIGKALFVVNIIQNSDGTYSADKTFEEIVQAYNEGKYNIVANFMGSYIFPLFAITNRGVGFEGIVVRANVAITIAYNNKIEMATEQFATRTSKLPNPYSLTFTGAVNETYDGSSAKTIEIPSGGSGETATPELLYSGTAANVSAFQQNIDMKGHRRFCVIVGGTKGESAISISNGFFYLGEKEYKIFYYTTWLGETIESYPEGCVTEHFTLMDQDKIAITYQQITNSINGISDNFQGNSSQFIAPKLAVLKGKNVAKEDGITLSFSAVVKSVTVYVFGY